MGRHSGDRHHNSHRSRYSSDDTISSSRSRSRHKHREHSKSPKRKSDYYNKKSSSLTFITDNSIVKRSVDKPPAQPTLQELEARAFELEDEFFKKQYKQRSVIRINENNSFPIDEFAKIILILENEHDLSVNLVREECPLEKINELSNAELTDLKFDIQKYLSIDSPVEILDYWKHLKIVVEDKIRQKSNESIHSNVDRDVDSFLSTIETNQLQTVVDQIKTQINNQDATIDTDFYEEVLLRAQKLISQAKFSEIYKEFYSRIVELKNKINTKIEEMENEKKETTEKKESEDNIKEVPLEMYELTPSYYLPGSVSPVLYDENDIKSEIMDELTDKKILQETRRSIIHKKSIESIDQSMLLDRNDIKRIANEQNDETVQEEMDFEPNQEIKLPDKIYEWSDKYQPRKPKYLNRVKMGFEWNRFNQAHYDEDNPPPKVVFGYKFNVFYPDTINQYEAPIYKISPCENSDFVIITFIGGAPYEDIAFKIVNREWDFHPKAGFQCFYERGILHLYFNFKRPKFKK